MPGVWKPLRLSCRDESVELWQAWCPLSNNAGHNVTVLITTRWGSFRSSTLLQPVQNHWYTFCSGDSLCKLLYKQKIHPIWSSVGFWRKARKLISALRRRPREAHRVSSPASSGSSPGCKARPLSTPPGDLLSPAKRTGGPPGLDLEPTSRFRNPLCGHCWDPHHKEQCCPDGNCLFTCSLRSASTSILSMKFTKSPENMKRNWTKNLTWNLALYLED